ncbi:MAG: 30S ribosome-binding factor RbfA [Candidatus Eiseniibacteriota bacterium]|nr:MAG: 30S ribosome-binding factor RbfA [Candidatus Eisenbacteria bacterium]
MSSQRMQRVGDLLRQEISEIMCRRMKDPRLGFLTVTSVEVSPDLRYAKVFISSPGTEEELASGLKVLAGASGFIRSELFKRVTLRFIPELSFRPDRSIAHGIRISKVLKDLREKDGGGTLESQ